VPRTDVESLYARAVTSAVAQGESPRTACLMITTAFENWIGRVAEIRNGRDALVSSLTSPVFSYMEEW